MWKMLKDHWPTFVGWLGAIITIGWLGGYRLGVLDSKLEEQAKVLHRVAEVVDSLKTSEARRQGREEAALR